MRPIDADVLESSIQEQTGKCMIKIFDPSVNLILQDIRNAPTVDAEPVKHGMWKAGVTCSKCGFIRQETRSGNPVVGRYCPNCGAKMDLKDGETK